MPEEKIKKPRLGQAATEFNVSMDRIIDILKKNGLEIVSPTLNSKLSEDMYLCLQKEFDKDKMVKEKSGHLSPKNKTEESKFPSSEKNKEEEKDNQHILIHKNPLMGPQYEEHVETHHPEPKIIGKLPLESLGKGSKNASGNKKEENSTETVVEKQEIPAAPQESSTDENPQSEESMQKKGENVKHQPEHIETVTHITGPKSIGFIDPETLKPKKKTSSKEKKSNKKEKQPQKTSEKATVTETPVNEAPVEQEKEEISTPQPAQQPQTQPAPEHIKTVVNPLKGPKILGTIDLSLIQNTKENGKKEDHRNGENGEKKKKKRKRVAKPVKTTNVPNIK